MTNEDVERNALLSMLPPSVTERIGDALRIVSATAGDVLIDPEAPIVDVFFPLDLVASLDQVIDDDDAAATPFAPGVAICGNEGVVGVERFFGAEVAINRATVQIGGRAALVHAEAAREEFARGGAFHRLLLRTADHLFLQTCAIGACERTHTIEQRLIRWLLMFDDRSPSGDIALTQEAISQLMRVRRVSVTGAARLLQVHGLISYARGVITLEDRAGLVERSCKCYRAIKASHDALGSSE